MAYYNNGAGPTTTGSGAVSVPGTVDVAGTVDVNSGTVTLSGTTNVAGTVGVSGGTVFRHRIGHPLDGALPSQPQRLEHRFLAHVRHARHRCGRNLHACPRRHLELAPRLHTIRCRSRDGRSRVPRPDRDVLAVRAHPSL
jgi:hypothetical protein